MIERKPINDSLDLHGLTVDEALIATEHFLYQSYQGGLEHVWIIHGRGTGVLKTEISRYVAGHSLVRSFYAANRFHGGNGAIQVNLILK
jgi:DNA mismatch repair protein MutS2